MRPDRRRAPTPTRAVLVLVAGLGACGGPGPGGADRPGPPLRSPVDTAAPGAGGDVGAGRRDTATVVYGEGGGGTTADTVASADTTRVADTVLAELGLELMPAGELARAVDRPMTVNFFEASDPRSLGMDPEGLERLDSAVLAAVARGAVPGAALAVGRHGRLVRLRGYGTLDPGGERLATPATIYDLASLTKVIGTTTAVMILDQEGRLDVDAPVAGYLPWWPGGHPDKARVTVRQLLEHRAGLAAFRPWYVELRGEAAYREALAAEALAYAPGTRTVYSDLGAMTLGFLVEAVGGRPLDAFLQERVFGPLDMDDTGFRPPPDVLPRVAPTELDTVLRHAHLRGVVHDENAWAMGGVAGHAGLFSTAWDLSVFALMMAGEGAVAPCVPDVGSGVPCTRARPDTVRILDPATVRRYVRRQDGAAGRALGWDTPSGRSSAGDWFTARAYGHTGFTGTSIWIDPVLDLFVVLLTNRVNPTRDNTGHVALRRTVHDLAALAITDRTVRRREAAR